MELGYIDKVKISPQFSADTAVKRCMQELILGFKGNKKTIGFKNVSIEKWQLVPKIIQLDERQILYPQESFMTTLENRQNGSAPENFKVLTSEGTINHIVGLIANAPSLPQSASEDNKISKDNLKTLADHIERETFGRTSMHC